MERKTARDTLPQRGRLTWIGLAPASGADPIVVPEAQIEIGTGIVGEHHARGGRGHRQVTLIQEEHLPAIAALVGCDAVRPEQLRRNLVVSKVNLAALKDRRFWVGDVLLEGSGDCDPCEQMERALGPGGLNAMVGHGGITARVIAPGKIRCGDVVSLAGEEARGAS